MKRFCTLFVPYQHYKQLSNNYTHKTINNLLIEGSDWWVTDLNSGYYLILEDNFCILTIGVQLWGQFSLYTITLLDCNSFHLGTCMGPFVLQIPILNLLHCLYFYQDSLLYFANSILLYFYHVHINCISAG
jgi:hypothetical protein